MDELLKNEWKMHVASPMYGFEVDYSGLYIIRLQMYMKELFQEELDECFIQDIESTDQLCCRVVTSTCQGLVWLIKTKERDTTSFIQNTLQVSFYNLFLSTGHVSVTRAIMDWIEFSFHCTIQRKPVQLSTDQVRSISSAWLSIKTGIPRGCELVHFGKNESEIRSNFTFDQMQQLSGLQSLEEAIEVDLTEYTLIKFQNDIGSVTNKGKIKVSLK